MKRPTQMNPVSFKIGIALLVAAAGGLTGGCDKKAESTSLPRATTGPASESSSTQSQKQTDDSESAEAPVQPIAGGFETSAKNPEARAHFAAGLTLLHFFEYEKARAEFKAAWDAEPGFAMAAWGEAMTYDHPLWGDQNRQKAVEALNRIAPSADARQATSLSVREKAFIDAADVLFAEGGKAERDVEYRDQMIELAGQFPDDDEAQTFAALSVLGAMGRERETREAMRALALVLPVLERNPNHAGALHVAMICCSDADHAQLARRYAERCAKVGANIGGALRATAQVYAALGKWDLVLATAERAAALGEDKTKNATGQASNEKPAQGRDYRAIRWEHYALLELGRTEDAEKLLRQVAQYADSGTPTARWHYAQMRALHLVEANWSIEATLPEAKTDGVEPSAAFADLFAIGYCRVKEKKIDEASAALRKLDDLLHRLEPSDNEVETTKPDTDIDTDHDAWSLAAGRVMAAQLDGLIQAASGATEDADQAVSDMMAEDLPLRLEFEPPVPPLPLYEGAGEILKQIGKEDEAEQDYDSAIKEQPGRPKPKKALDALRARPKENKNEPEPGSVQ